MHKIQKHTISRALERGRSVGEGFIEVGKGQSLERLTEEGVLRKGLATITDEVHVEIREDVRIDVNVERGTNG